MAVLQSRVLYGLKTDIAGNVHYITDTEIVYPVGNALSIHNLSQRRQRLLRLPDKHETNIISITPNRKYVAVCEVGEKPTINIYDVNSLRRKKSLVIPYEAPDVRGFSCVCFSHDSRCLAAVTGEPDQTMLYYAWEKGKVESSTKVASTQQTTVNCVACNPGDTGVMAVGGKYVFKFLTVSETLWRPYGFAKAENIIVGSMTWLNTDRLLAGTVDGRILYLENGDLKNIYSMSETISMNLKIRDEYVLATATATATSKTANEYNEYNGEERDNGDETIRCLVGFQRGFAYGTSYGTIVVYEKDGPNRYTKRHAYFVPSQMSKNATRDLYRINGIAVNPSHDGLAVTCGWSRLLCAKLWAPGVGLEPLPLETMGHDLHHGPIGGLSMCAWKSILVTWGEDDRSVRVWDYETENLLLTKQYHEDLYSVAIHPFGLHCLIGFSDKLRFMSILVDDLATIREIPVRNCRTLGFSHGGHLFAAVNGNIVQIYASVSFASRHLLKGHTGRVRGLVWARNDASLVSVGTEGAIYVWDANTGARLSEIVVKAVSLADVALSGADSSAIYCISSDDDRIREMRESGSVSREFSLNTGQFSDKTTTPPLVSTMAADDSGILIGFPGGRILFVGFPLQEPLETAEFHLHSSDVTSLCLSFDQQTLVSAARDGTVCLWRVARIQLAGAAPESVRTTEILVGKSDLDDKVRLIRELTSRIRETETEHAYKTRQTEVSHNDKVRDIHRGYCEAIEELRDRIEKMKQDRDNEINAINADVERMRSANEEQQRRTESDYEARLIVEYDKYRELERFNNETRRDYENKISTIESSNNRNDEATRNKYEAQLHSKNLTLEETREEMAHQARLHESIERQMEDDTDRETLELRTTYEARLSDERQTSFQLKGEVGVLRNKYQATRREAEDLRRRVSSLGAQQAHAQNLIRQSERDALDLKKEITERDATIRDKEKRIYDLKRDNRELEKFKFVLNYKIRELNSQIEPRDTEIEQLGKKIRDMEIELANLDKTNDSLELELRELSEKLSSSRRACEMEISKNRRTEQILRRMRIDIIRAVEFFQRPNDLKKAVMNLHHRYSAEENFLRSRREDNSAECEFAKQRHHLEKAVTSLARRVVHETTATGGGKCIGKVVGEDDYDDDDDEDDRLVADENVELLVELGSLRKQLKKARKNIADMENLLGISTGLDVGPKEARKKLFDACHGKDELEKLYMTKIRECEKMMETLQDNIKGLLCGQSNPSSTVH